MRSRWFAVLSCAVLWPAAAFAQPPAYLSHVGPIPPALAAATTVFVSNAGSDSGLFPEPFTGDPNRPYTEFYSLLQATGAFQLMANPADADLVVELQLTAPYGPSSPSKQNGAADPLPAFRLVVYDRRSHYILWTENDTIDAALTQKTHDRNFDDALKGLVNLFLQDCGKTVSSPPAARGGAEQKQR